MTCFVDTSALLAVMDKDDAVHKEAKAFWERLTEQQATLVTTNYVMLETVALLQHRIGVPAVRRFHDDILPILTIDWISSVQHIFRRYNTYRAWPRYSRPTAGTSPWSTA